MTNSFQANFSVKRNTLAWIAIGALVLQLVSPAVFGLPVAQATTVIGSVTLNGGATVEVTPGDPIAVVVNVSGIGTNPRPHWKSTSYQFGSGSTNCVSHANHTSGGTASEAFTVSAPSLPGTYDFTVTIYHAENCNNSQDFYTLTLTSVVIVIDQFTLSVSKNGSGTGTVTSTPAGIACGSDCSEAYDEDTVVSLTATPDTGSTFDGWSGDCSADGTVTMSGNKTCTAEFNLEPPTTGTLTIVKDLPNDNGGTATEIDFAVYIDGGSSTWGSHELPAGSYAVSEDIVAGYAQDFSACGTDGVVVVTEGVETICTITNDDIAPSLALVKEVDNSNVDDESLMSLADAWTLYANDGPTPISGAGGVISDGTFSAGTYNLSESTGPEGYTASAWSCVGGTQNGAQVTLALGESATCTITNTAQAGSITLTKDVVNDNGGGSAENGGLGVNEFGLFIDDVTVDSGVETPLKAGTHYIGELIKPGYLFTSISGDNCPSDLTQGDGESFGIDALFGSVSVGLGQNISCTINNNDQQATLIIKKYVFNSDTDGHVYTLGPSDFTINVSGNNVSPSSFNDSDNDPETGTTVTLDAGSYNVTEDSVDGYSMTSKSTACSSDDADVIQIGESRTCTIANSSAEVTMGRIIVDKVTYPSGEPQLFDFSLTGTDGFSLADGEEYDSNFVEPGDYTLSEGVVDGWAVDNISCSGNEPVYGSEITFNVGAGEVVLCTVYNTKLAQIVVEKVTEPASEISFAFTTTYGDGFDLSDTGSNTSAYLEPGTYSVTEGEMPEGWYQSAATCDNGDTPDAITVGAGDLVTCTFTNTQYGSITIEKVTNPVENEQTFEFDTNFTEGNVELGSGQSTDPYTLQPGNYNINELTSEGWTLTDLTCDGPEGSSTIDGSSVSVDLPAGVAITCVFTNTEDTEPMTDLSVTKEVDDATPDVGQNITYTITVSNTGPDEATGVVVTELLSLSLTSVSSLPSQGTYNSETGLWTVGTLAAQGSATLGITATVNSGTAGQTISNTASAVGDQVDPDSENSSSSEDITVNEQSDLSVSKEVSDTTPDVNQTITYTIIVSNSGPNAATGVVVNDDLPAGVTYVSHSASQGTYDNGTGLWTVGALDDDASATLTIEVTVNSGTGGQTITNTASASSDQSDPNSDNSADSAAMDVNQPTVVITGGGGGGGGGGVPSLYIHTEQVGGSSDTTATITWFTNLLATSRVVYDAISHSIAGTLPNFDYAQTTVEDSTLNTYHSMVISGLTPGTNYYFRPVSSDVSHTVTGVELSLATSGSVAGDQTGPAGAAPASGGESTPPPSGGTPPPPPPTESGEVAGVETQELAQAPVGEEPPAEEPTPELVGDALPAPEACNPWVWLLVALNVLAAAWFWKKYSKSQKWNKYLWIIDLILTAILTWVWLGSCGTGAWLLVLLVVSILYALFTSEGEPTSAPAQ